MELNRYYRAKTLVKRGLIAITNENEFGIYFETEYKGNLYSIIYDKRRERWSCTCEYGSMWGKGKDCVHIMAGKRILNEVKNESKDKIPKKE